MGDYFLILAIVVIVSFVIQIALIWSVFNMRNHTEKQTIILVSAIRLLSKIAQNTGTDKDEVNKLL